MNYRKEEGKMHFTYHKTGFISAVEFSGNLQRNRIHELSEALMIAVENGECIILDLSKVKKISYHGLKAIYRAQSAARFQNKNLIIEGISPILCRKDPYNFIAQELASPPNHGC